MYKRPFFSLFPVALAFGQLTPNSVTVTASSSQNAHPDQAVFAIDVLAPLDASRDDVLAVAQGAGLTAANIHGVSYLPANSTGAGTTSTTTTPTGSTTIGITLPGTSTESTVPLLDWSFALAVPISSIKSTTGMLTAFQNSVAGKNNGMTVAFAVQGLRVSPQSQQSQNCSISGLLNNARAQALNLAGSAGMSVGAIQAISGPAASGYTPCWITVKFALGAF